MPWAVGNVMKVFTYLSFKRCISSVLYFIVISLLSTIAMSLSAFAAEPSFKGHSIEENKICSKPIIIPQRANQYKARLIREARFVWGLDAKVSTFAAQIHAESLWQKDAISFAGAQGLTQFMPTTANWMPSIDKNLANPNPYNPAWAIRAQVRYNKWHFERVEGITQIDRAAFMLSAYNGGLGWVYKDKKKAKKIGLNPLIYFNSVEKVNAGRRKSAFTENRCYPDIILRKFECSYIKNGWGKGFYHE